MRAFKPLIIYMSYCPYCRPDQLSDITTALDDLLNQITDQATYHWSYERAIPLMLLLRKTAPAEHARYAGAFAAARPKLLSINSTKETL